MNRRRFLKAALGGLAAVALPIPIPGAPAKVFGISKEAYLLWEHPYQGRDTAFICPGSLDDHFGYTPVFDLQAPSHPRG